METRAALAEWQGEALTVWKTSRAVHANDRQTLAQVLGLPPAQVRVICTSMGGGFGNKDESRLAVLVALLAGRRDAPCAWNTAVPKSLLPGGIGSRPSRTCASVWSRTVPRRLSPCAAS
jgi:CO/xanthine dehydrogenase Mo-binding subunit